MTTLNEYQQHNRRLYKPHVRLSEMDAALLDWVLGLAGEVGELAELVKHCVFHGESLNKMIVAKELGDILWYVGATADTLGIKLQDVMELNKAKLDHRHGAVYSDATSADRKSREKAFEKTDEYRDLFFRIMGAKTPSYANVDDPSSILGGNGSGNDGFELKSYRKEEK